MANASRIQLRKDTSANWISAAPILANGELGIETDSQVIKVGDGSTSWANLPVVNAIDAFQSLYSQNYILQGATTTPPTFGTSSIFPSAVTLDASSTYEVEMEAVISAFTGSNAATKTGDGLFGFQYGVSTTHTGGTGGVSKQSLNLTTGGIVNIAVGMTASWTGGSGSPKTVTAVDVATKTITLNDVATVPAATTITFTNTVPPSAVSLNVLSWQKLYTAAQYGGATNKLTSQNTVSSYIDLTSFTSGDVVPVATSVAIAANSGATWVVKLRGTITTGSGPLTNLYPYFYFRDAVTPFHYNPATTASINASTGVAGQYGSYIRYTKVMAGTPLTHGGPWSTPA